MEENARASHSKLGWDGRDRGAVNVAMALGDARIEVLYLDRCVFPDKMGQVILQECLDVAGMGSLEDAQRTFVDAIRA